MVGLIMAGGIVDGRAGGLVIGRSHSQGDIHMIQYTDGKFSAYRCLEGGEYIMNKSASEAFADRLVEINNYKVDGFSESQFNLRPLRTIITFAEPHDKFLFVDHEQFVVNRAATALNLEELELLNESVNQYAQFDMDQAIHVQNSSTNLKKVTR